MARLPLTVRRSKRARSIDLGATKDAHVEIIEDDLCAGEGLGKPELNHAELILAAKIAIDPRDQMVEGFGLTRSAVQGGPIQQSKRPGSRPTAGLASAGSAGYPWCFDPSSEAHSVAHRVPILSNRLFVSVPHHLSKRGAFRRLNCYHLQFRASVLGQATTGSMNVTSRSVRLNVFLPWLLANLARAAEPLIVKEGTLMLERKTSCS